MKRTSNFFLALLAVLTLTAQTATGQVRCHVNGAVSDGTQVVALVIYRDGTDPRNSQQQLTVRDGHFECDIEEAQIEKYHIVDFGEMQEKDITSRTAEFFVEDGADVTIRLDGDSFSITSTGNEFQQWQQMEQTAMTTFLSAYEALNEGDEAAMSELEKQYHQWILDYYENHPMLGFLLELSGRLSRFHFNDTSLAAMLDIYHSKYANLYAGHPVHQRIAEQEKKEYQMYGRKYNDYDVRTMDGRQVRASDYYKDRLTVVICWASWCAPCIREANEIIPIYRQYCDRGLNVFSLAREFKSTDAMRKAVERSGYPWPCLVDLDDEFHVFEKHGTLSSALFLIDREGTVIGVFNSVEELKSKLEEIFKDNQEQ